MTRNEGSGWQAHGAFGRGLFHGQWVASTALAVLCFTGCGSKTRSDSAGANADGTGADGTDGSPAVIARLCGEPEDEDAYSPGYVPSAAVQLEARELVQRMTPEQKLLQLMGIYYPQPVDHRDIFRSLDDEELGLRGHWWRHGTHGVALEGGVGRAETNSFATSFPVGAAQGATFDLDLIYRVGQAIADEATASRNTVLMAPSLSLLRHPYWGRAQESFGEDSFHVGRTGSAFTAGAQTFISACALHYLGNNVESGQFRIDSQMDEQTLREIYARPYEMVVKDGGIGCVMAAHNSVNGQKSTQNRHLLREVLRDDFGFEGIIISDWRAMPAPYHGLGPVSPEEGRANAAAAIDAGLNVELPWLLNFEVLPDMIAEGSIDVALVDAAVAQVVEQKLRFRTAYFNEHLGLSPPTTSFDGDSITGNSAHLQLARETARKSMVLLKNQGGLLPLSNVAAVAVIGASYEYTVPSDNPRDKVVDFARDVALGDRGWSTVVIDPSLGVGPLDGITSAAPAGVRVVGGNSAEAAADADVVVVVVGLTAGDEGAEFTGASDRQTLSLDPVHDALIQDARALGKPVVVVVQAGGVVDMPWLDQVDAVIMAWYPGQVGGAAMGELLFGHANFSGRLPVTWPTHIDQFPVFHDHPNTVMDYYAGYRRFDQLALTPLFPFGYGLSYSEIEYESVTASCSVASKRDVITLSVGIKNNGALPAEEVVMVFASYPDTQARRSVKELKGFARVSLEPGQAEQVRISVRVEDLKYWDEPLDRWVIESGRVLLRVGPHAGELPLGRIVDIE